MISKTLSIIPLTTLLLSTTLPVFAQEKVPALVGELVLPTGLKFNGVEFGGISGLDYDPAQNVYYAISDDRSEKAPARFYKLKLDIDASGIHGLDILETNTLLDTEGKPFAIKDVDAESIRFNPESQTLYWSSEGDRKGKPSVREMKLDGSFVREFKLAEAYLPDENKTRGTRNNLAFESLAITVDGKTLLAGTENALAQDGEIATLDKGSKSRIISFDIASGEATAEHVYETDAIFAKATLPPFWNDNGLSEFMTDGSNLLTVERSYAHGVGNRISIYRASFDGATDVNGKLSLEGIAATPLKKELLLRLDEGTFGLDVDNIESITWGPEIDGAKTLVIASDNNFNTDQFTQFIVIKLP